MVFVFMFSDLRRSFRLALQCVGFECRCDCRFDGCRVLRVAATVIVTVTVESNVVATVVVTFGFSIPKRLVWLGARRAEPLTRRSQVPSQLTPRKAVEQLSLIHI